MAINTQSPVYRRQSLGQKNPDCISCEVKECSILRSSGEECLTLISRVKKVISYLPGQRIIMEGSTARGIYFVYDGKVKIYKTDGKGQEIIIRFAKPGEIIGFTETEESNEYQISAMAVDETTICFLDKETFETLINMYPEIAVELMRVFRKELYQAQSKTVKLATLNVPEKVADALLTMYDAYGASGAKNTLRLTLSRQDIANLAGTTKEQVSKVISDFKERGIVHAKGRQIDLLDLDALQKIAG